MNVPKVIVNDPLQKGNPKYLPSVLLLETSTTGTQGSEMGVTIKHANTWPKLQEQDTSVLHPPP